MDALVRSFVCVDMPLSLREAVWKEMSGFRGELRELKWVPVEGMHVTLLFCGEQTAEVLGRFSRALGKLLSLAGPPSFSLAAGRLGGFPALNRFRTLFLSLEGDMASLQKLASLCGMAGAEAGIPGDNRPFHPHLTLARARVPVHLSREWALAELPSWRAETVSRFRSDLLPSGPVYTLLESWRLEEPFHGEKKHGNELSSRKE